jgi:hypothetical protein
MADSVTITYTLTKLAHWRAIRDVTVRTAAHWFAWAFFVGLPYVFLAIGYYKGLDMSRLGLNLPASLIGGPLLMLVGFPLIHYWTAYNLHRKNALLAGPQTFELTPTRLLMRGPMFNSDLDWNAIVKVIETRHNFLFYVSNAAAHFLPKDDLNSEQLAALRQHLRTWLPNRARLREPAAKAAA